MSSGKRFKHRIEYAAVRILVAAVRVLPLPVASALGAFLGWVACELIGIRREVAVGNVERGLGVDRRRARRIVSRCYRNLGRSLVDFAAFFRLDRRALGQMVTFRGLEHLERCLEEGKGAVLFTGHFGSWELLGAALAAAGYPVHFLVGEQSNKLVDGLMNRLRSAQRIGIVTRSNALKKVLRLLARNQFVALLADQDARASGVFVDFLGQPASTFRGPALFALRRGAPVVPGFIIRRGATRHLAIIEEPLWPREDLGEEEAVRELTQRYTSVLEAYIRRHPDHYFWPHRRWKTKPPTYSVTSG